MPTLALQSAGSRISLESERLIVTIPDHDGTPAEVPLAEIDRVVLGSCSHVTAPALAELMRRKSPSPWLPPAAAFLGRSSRPANRGR